VDEAPVLRLVPSESNPGGSASEAGRPESRRGRSAAAAEPAEPPAEARGAQPPPAPALASGVDPAGGKSTSGVRSPEPPAGSPPPVLSSAWQRQLAIAVDFWRRRLTGEYEVDDFGFDPDLTENVLVPLLRPVYHTWFRTEVIGIHNLPREGGALLVANHAGGLWAIDGAMTAIAVHVTHPDHRYLRMLGADLVFTTPVLGPLARKTGATLACNADAQRLLNEGELVGVWPEGFKGIGKPFSERYKLQRFGRGGFVSAALRTGVPIIPVSVVGSEEVYPVLGNAKTLARLLNLPYFPLTPTFPWLGPLGLLPLPVKWYIEFGEPIPTADYGAQGSDDPMLVFELTDRVREIIQSTLYRLLTQRRSVWR
jgi:1-acyl-sn-glycerol-3-phosphate acyltransferase